MTNGEVKFFKFSDLLIRSNQKKPRLHNQQLRQHKMKINVEGVTEENEPKKRRWLIPAATTLIGVLVSILVAWYQINLSEERSFEAEKERSKSVKNELVQIVEEHVINKKPLDASRLARLAEFRARQEHLIIVPTVSEIVENAEFNIIKSQYLEFEKKQQFKKIFNDIYAELTIPKNLKYSGIFENTVNDIYASIKSGKTKEIPAKVNKLVSDFNSKISELEADKKIREKTNISDIFRAIFEQPKTLVIVMSGYVLLIYAALLYRRKKRQHREIQHEMYEEYIRERTDILNTKKEKEQENKKEP